MAEHKIQRLEQRLRLNCRRRIVSRRDKIGDHLRKRTRPLFENSSAIIYSIYTPDERAVEVIIGGLIDDTLILQIQPDHPSAAELPSVFRLMVIETFGGRVVNAPDIAHKFTLRKLLRIARTYNFIFI